MVEESTGQIQGTGTRLRDALPFYLVFVNFLVLGFIAYKGSWWIPFGFLYMSWLASFGDAIFSLNRDNLDPLTEERKLFWYTLVTKLWVVPQIALIFFAIWQTEHAGFSIVERVFLMLLIGVSSGMAGIVIAHELIHQKNRFERFLGDLLLGTVLYGHFRTEHVQGHHRYVGTPRDPATARYNESLYHFIARVIPKSFASAWQIEKGRLAQQNKPLLSLSNPFVLYGLIGLAFLAIAFLIGGASGVFYFVLQAFMAVFVLETTNYIEHYGLCRMYLSDGKYEHVAPRHSWNANHRITNYLLINLQRHSDHHYKPNRRFPLLQALEETEAPQLPHGYLVMAFIAFNPMWWRKVMNPRVRRWRSMYYPQILDWRDYNNGTTPWPK